MQLFCCVLQMIEMTRWLWFWPLAFYIVFKLLKNRIARTVALCAIYTLTTSAAMHYYKICELSFGLKPTEYKRFADIGQEYYVMGIENNWASIYSQKDLFDKSRKYCLTAGNHTNRPGVIRQLWHMAVLLREKDLEKIYGDKLRAIDPTLLGRVFIDHNDYYDAWSTDKYETTFTNSRHYSFDTEESMLRRLELHRQYLSIDSALTTNYLGSGFGPTSPVLEDLEALGDFYKSKNNFVKASEYFEHGAKLCALLKEPAGINSDFTQQQQKFWSEYKACQAELTGSKSQT